MNIQLHHAVVTINKNDAFTVSLMARAVINNRPSFRSVDGTFGQQPATLYTESAGELSHRPQRLTLRSSTGEKVHLFPEDVAWLEGILSDLQNS
jgi:hypothetical protein